jgi:hypothetical protein
MCTPRPHLLATLALWDYCEASARRIFGRALGDANADGALHAVCMEGEAGMTRNGVARLLQPEYAG